ncbi:Polysialic acid transport protein KpsD [Methylophilaceae bacterium]|nr:Polysialic acid transport protein KpsD [Methylophilaceae bacterium]
MRTFILAVVCQILLLSSVVAEANNAAYKLRAGDTIQISVWGEDKLPKDTKVLPDGSITYPLAGRVEVGGLTTTEVETRVAEKLKVYIPDPQVSVVITNIEGNRAFVLGKVVKPGPVQMTGPMTVLEALSIAGGFDKFANLAGIKVLRNTPQGQRVISVPYDRLIQGQDLDKNIVLNVGDTILVP